MAIYLGNQKINVKSNAHEISDDSLKLFFEAGGHCGYSAATSFVDVIPYNATSNLTSMYQFFYYSQKLKEVGLLDTSKVTSMSNMFCNCSSLTTVPQFDTSSVTSMSNMFCNCSSLTTVPQFDTSMVTNMYYMFYGCKQLTAIPQLDTSKVTGMHDMFYNCSAITEIHMKNMAVNFDIHYCTKMEREALLEVINNLATVTSTRTLTMGSTLKAKLTDDDIAIATAKGWTIA